MPLYQVKCRTCSHEFETFAKMSDESFPCEAPGCKGECDKLVSAPRRERVFAGSEGNSHRFRFLPGEVAEKRARMGRIGHECIHETGNVRFENRKQEREFVNTFMEKVYSCDDDGVRRPDDPD